MRLDVFYSPTHKTLVDKYLEPSATASGLSVVRNPDTTINPEEAWCGKGTIELGLWTSCRLAYGCPCSNELRVFSGADVVFLKPFVAWAEQFMRDSGAHIAYADDYGLYCQDFWIWTDIIQVRHFFADQARAMFDACSAKTKQGDSRLAWLNNQHVHLDVIKNSKLHVVKIPKEIVTNYPACIKSTDGIWNKGDKLDFNVPESALAFHANWTVGVENKTALLDYVLGKNNHD